MKKKASIILSVLMVFTMLCAAQLPAAALPAGTTIYVNAHEAGWDNAYIYGWDCGLQGEFVQMEETPHRGIYSFTMPQQSPDGLIYFYFCDRNSWEGQERTESLSTQAGKNFYTIYEKDSYGKWSGRWSYVAPIEPTEPPTQPPTEPPTEPPTVPTETPTVEPTEPPTERPYIIAPSSTYFDSIMFISLFTNCDRATYSVNSKPEVDFNDGDFLYIADTTKLRLKGYDKNGAEICSATYTYSLIEPSSNMLPAGTQILFDNTDTNWTNVYIYIYSNYRYGEFFEMEPVQGTNLFTFSLTSPVRVGSTFGLFINQPNWSGAIQIKDVTLPSAEVNTVVPNVTSDTNMYDVTWTYTPPPQEAIIFTTLPQQFAQEINVGAFTNQSMYLTYSIDGGEEIACSDETRIYLTDTASITFFGYDVSGSIIAATTKTYTKVGMTTIIATVADYDGPVYAYLFGGTRHSPAFYLIDRQIDGRYIIEFEGDAQVIFTTTNDWVTAVKLNMDEPLIVAGSTVDFCLTYPVE